MLQGTTAVMPCKPAAQTAPKWSNVLHSCIHLLIIAISSNARAPCSVSGIYFVLRVPGGTSTFNQCITYRQRAG